MTARYAGVPWSKVRPLAPPIPTKRIPDGRTIEDIKNGWSYEAWAAYHAERDRAAGESIFHKKPVRPTTVHHQYEANRLWIAQPNSRRR